MKKLKNLQIDIHFVAGIITLFIWTFTPGVKRLLNESLSMFIFGAIDYIVGGIILIVFKLKRNGFTSPKQVNKKYWLLCAVPYFLYLLCSVCSSGLSSSREGSMVVNLFTAMWPLSGLVCSVLIMKRKTTKFFPFACLLSIVGVGFASLTSLDGTFIDLIKSDGIAILFAICEALTWGIYSGYYSKYVKDIKEDYQAIVQLLFGLVMLVVVIVKGETINEFNTSVLLTILFQVLLSTVVANYVWNYSMTGESCFKIILLSNLSPVFSSIFSSLILGIEIKLQLIIGACIVVVSTILTKKCIINR